MPNAFAPRAAGTKNVTVAATSDRVALPDITGSHVIRIYNDDTQVAFVEFGDSSVAAVATTGMPVPPGGVEVVAVRRLPDNGLLYAAAIGTAANTRKIYFTPGRRRTGL